MTVTLKIVAWSEKKNQYVFWLFFKLSSGCWWIIPDVRKHNWTSQKQQSNFRTIELSNNRTFEQSNFQTIELSINQTFDQSNFRPIELSIHQTFDQSNVDQPVLLELASMMDNTILILVVPFPK